MISSTQEALTALSVTNDVLTKEQKPRLKEDGYCLISIEAGSVGARNC